MRGKVVRIVNLSHVQGITPAYAGKRTKQKNSAVMPRDHPRVCGEKVAGSYAALLMIGSPPRMRGKASSSSRPARYPGITPAYAGKSQLIKPTRAVSGDHPRVCGEKSYTAYTDNPAVGSPPRMRGKVNFFGVRAVVVGITPAYAGKSYMREAWRQQLEDHPRVCGEKMLGRSKS